MITPELPKLFPSSNLMYYVYVLKSEKDKKLYIGFTSDLKRRFNEHNNGLSKATKHRTPFTLAYYEAYKSESVARKRERQLKRFDASYYHLKTRISECL